MTWSNFHLREPENDPEPPIQDQSTAMMSKTPRNSVTVESPYGMRTFALRDGDVTNSVDPVLIVPTHANKDFQPTGRVLSLATERFHVDFANTEKIVSGRREAVGTYRLRDTVDFHGNEILLVRIPGKTYADRSSGDNPFEPLSEALWSLFGSLAALELRTNALTSMAMPLLAATRGYDVHDLLKVILDHSLAWLRISRYMNAVNFYLIDSDALNVWDIAMDDVLGRHSIDTAQNALVSTLRSEILTLINSTRTAKLPSLWREILIGLDSSIRLKSIPIERVAVDARRFAEVLVCYLLTESTGVPPKGMLGLQLESLKGQKRVAPWIVAHLECLKSFGNAAAHSNQSVSYDPPSLREDDLVGLLASLQRVLEFALGRVESNGRV